MRRPTWAQSVFKQISGISSKVWEFCETGEQISPVPSCPGWELTGCWIQIPTHGVPGVPERCHRHGGHGGVLGEQDGCCRCCWSDGPARGPGGSDCFPQHSRHLPTRGCCSQRHGVTTVMGEPPPGGPPLSSPLCSTSSPWLPPLAGLFVFFRWLCLPSSPRQEMSRAGSVKPGRFVVWAVSVCPCAPRCALSQLLDCTGQNPPPEGVDSIRTAVNASWRHKDPKCNEHPRCLDAPGAPRGSAPHRGVGWMCTVLEGAMAMGTTWLLSTK